jgi:hypothetical protein
MRHSDLSRTRQRVRVVGLRWHGSQYPAGPSIHWPARDPDRMRQSRSDARKAPAWSMSKREGIRKVRRRTPRPVIHPSATDGVRFSECPPPRRIGHMFSERLLDTSGTATVVGQPILVRLGCPRGIPPWAPRDRVRCAHRSAATARASLRLADTMTAASDTCGE